MEKLNNPLSGMKVNKKTKLIIIVLLILISSITITYKSYKEKHRKEVFNNLNITFKEVKAVEYGKANYEPIDLVKDVSNGEIVSYTKDIDTTSIGTQKVMFVLKKENIYKVINVEVEVVDKEKPNITIKDEKISIKQGTNYNVIDNITSIIDEVDGELQYLETPNNDIAHYTITTDLNTNVPGNYSVNIKAIDKSRNESNKTFSINVIANTISNNKNTIDSTIDTNSLVATSKQYLGYRYTPGGASPETGFDCSGFVYYIYGLFGKNVGRSTSDQIYAGKSVSRENIQAGDIIVWSSSSNGTPTHTSIYIGDGNMIHAANSNDGVIISSLSHWEKYAGHIISIRRV